ncbi:hypothetical protein LEP1GSC016_2181 [Leptospira borgpetersenii serovar Hardjo-bovis str. Sponselee]|uniref:Uncharacterized protein n=1 Tax=Leptospira borgpetersenii serovar Hardjo-bovis str. Sponselee TaxID=1303729 RepID=M6C6D9_LEPBO|nr:hypothetical protein LEP1GSC016_2181 [Leptospira borgpetersenii serovar Hardjo-bovis str. Sponselee]
MSSFQKNFQTIWQLLKNAGVPTFLGFEISLKSFLYLW